MTPEDKTAILALRSRPGATNRKVAEAAQRAGGYAQAARAELDRAALAEAAAAEARVRRSGVELIAIDEPGYPPALAEADDAPLLLLVRGQLERADDPAVALVGSRRASREGRELARTLGEALGASGITVVSGLARGIDAAAHEGALAGGGRTLAVLGSGIDVLYPPEHLPLAHRIAKAGALLTELPPGTRPLPWHFPMRNRILAALARVVVVVEAAERSGSLITARLATELGRSVLAVPGSPLCPAHRGTNRLIQEGAGLLQHIRDLVDELPEPVRARFSSPVVEAEPAATDEEERLLAALDARESRPLEWLAREARLTPPQAMATLSALELRGRAAKLPGSRWIALRPTRSLGTGTPAAPGTVLSSGFQHPPEPLRWRNRW